MSEEILFELDYVILRKFSGASFIASTFRIENSGIYRNEFGMLLVLDL